MNDNEIIPNNNPNLYSAQLDKTGNHLVFSPIIAWEIIIYKDDIGTVIKKAPELIPLVSGHRSTSYFIFDYQTECWLTRSDGPFYGRTELMEELQRIRRIINKTTKKKYIRGS